MQDLHSGESRSQHSAEHPTLDAMAEATCAPDPLNELTGRMRDLLRDQIEQGREIASRTTSALGEEIRRRPGAALVVAASVGLLAGLCVCSRQGSARAVPRRTMSLIVLRS